MLDEQIFDCVCDSRCLRDVCLVSTVLSPSLRCLFHFLVFAPAKKDINEALYQLNTSILQNLPHPTLGEVSVEC